MRLEGDDGRRQAGVDGDLDHAAVAAVHAVERADRDRARLPLELNRCVRDLHRRASASSERTIRSSSASSIRNGPTSVRRSETQWPPSASAIART